MSRLTSKQRWGFAAGALFLILLLAAVFTFGSLGVPFEPKNWRELLTLYAVTTFITAALLTFGLILVRTALRLWAERRKDQLGARFKTKMVVGAMAISLLPVLFMFFVSYSLLNRTLGRWFPRPLEIASEQTQLLLNDLGRTQIPRLRNIAHQIEPLSNKPVNELLGRAFMAGADAVWILDQNGNAVSGGVVCDAPPEVRDAQTCMVPGVLGKRLRVLQSGIEIWEAGNFTYSGARISIHGSRGTSGYLLTAYRSNATFLDRLNQIQAQTAQYYAEKQSLRALKRQMLLILLFFTMLVLFSVMWVALFLSKQVTVPIQALAEGTREISSGNFDYQVPDQVQDELGILARSFNNMTKQLRDNRSQIDQFTRNLQQAVQELERRRQLMETVLENIPTGVVSLDATGVILRCNTAVNGMLGANSRDKQTLDDLLGTEASRAVQYLMRRSLRMGVVSREIETVAGGRVLHLAVTVSPLGPRRGNTGYVLVLDDLTEMLRSQKSAAWQEVARRIAHEIKNPLTPIQLSAQRLLRFLDRRSTSDSKPVDAELTTLVQECSRLIEREVSTLAGLVNEFSQFVRFPTAKLVPTEANTIVQEATEVFSNRLDGVTIKTMLAENLPQVRADAGLLRSVLINLIDNAAESLEHSSLREIIVSTRNRVEAESVEISVADTGHGISPEDKDKLFLPQFSTKDRGTGLGLAIAARIIAEHGGTIHAEDNHPVGSRFLIELPVTEAVPAAIGQPHEPAPESSR
ncbi:MAG TPA: ATP-binding protein [Verrucomicrobiae bacterium]|jgi:two-component system nitrogen regulation sensor histidine kinase NtrY|nr:ATP-binding protein [Verrucomicrobiae bacterium]